MARKVDAVFRLVNQFSPEMLKCVANMEEGGQAAKNLGREFKDLGKKTKSTGDMMTKGLTVPIAAVGAFSLSAYKDVKAGTDAIIMATGATGDALNSYKDIMTDVAGRVADSFENIGSTLGEVQTRFGFTDDALNASTEKFMQFSRVTGIDAAEGVRLVSRAMGDADIDTKDYAKVLDQLTVAGQASGIAVDALSENLAKYGAPLRALGMDTEESIALFSTWEKAGVNTETAFSGMKKAISNWGAAGKDSREEFQKILADIKAAPDIATATTKAIEVFGAKAGPDLADAIQGGRFEYEEMLALIENSGGSLDSTYNEMLTGTERFQMSMNNLKSAGAELGGVIMEMIAPYIDRLSSMAKGLKDWFDGLSDSQKELVVKAALVVAAFGPVLSVMGRLSISIGKNISTFTKIVKVMKNVGKFLIANPWMLAITAIAVSAYLIIKNWDKIVPFFKNLWGKVTSFFSQGMAWIDEHFPVLGEIIRNQIETITTIFDGIKTFLSGIIDFVKGVFTGDWELAWTGVKDIFAGIFKMLAGIAKAPINAVISIINGAIKRINKIGFTVPDWVPGPLKGKEFKPNIPEIPKLYKGTSYWPGGAAMVHDRGGEIIDLPRGSRVYPHDTSLSMARAEGTMGGGLSVNIAKLADQITVRDDRDIEKLSVEIVQEIIKEVKKAKINKGTLGVV